MKNILVTGGKGQLATCIRDIALDLFEFNFIYVDIEELDITNKKAVQFFFKKNKIDYCINCAAYTAVDRAETDKELANKVNAIGPKNLAEVCNLFGTILIQISTDFVFDGSKSQLYTENDKTNPISVYGTSKLDGELAVSKALKKHFILRTSWLYSEYGHNFVKTMLRLGAEKEVLNIISDQIGTPTYAKDLASVIIKLITENNSSYGTFHYSNEGVASWYDFTKAIFDERNIKIRVLPINTESYPTPAKRPAFSVLDKSKIKKTLDIEIPYWKDSLITCLNKL